jgi:glycosyltransferase involved in cell wall biosynthesis
MNPRPLVSILMPFLNTPAKFMKEAIESVISQTYDNWELWLIDDGSTDGSTAFAQNYVDRYPAKLRYLEHPKHENRGPGASRQLAMSHAAGLLIALLDSDDIWLPNKLEEQVPILESRPEVCMLYGGTKYWFSWAEGRDNASRDFFPNPGVSLDSVVEPPKLVLLYLAGKAAAPCTCSALIRREIIEQVGGFELEKSIYEDLMFFVKICLEYRVLVAGSCWDWYRQHSGSFCASTARAGQNRFLHVAYLDWLAAYASRRQCTNAEFWRSLRRQRWLYRLPGQGSFFADHPQLLRRVKKWLLRAEDFVLPTPIRRRLWLGGDDSEISVRSKRSRWSQIRQRHPKA